MGDEKLLREIGARIHARRRALGLTQEQLAEQMDVSIQMVSNLELGKKAIRPENLVKVCEALDISADYILRGRGAEWEISACAQKLAALPADEQDLIGKIIDKFTKNL